LGFFGYEISGHIYPLKFFKIDTPLRHRSQHSDH
jgi:hypothetical protein